MGCLHGNHSSITGFTPLHHPNPPAPHAMRLGGRPLPMPLG